MKVPQVQVMLPVSRSMASDVPLALRLQRVDLLGPRVGLRAVDRPGQRLLSAMVTDRLQIDTNGYFAVTTYTGFYLCR
ncbi:hypothetical protein [Nonomuraea aurantiaca]|uniref:hypothetical protein n=1 Tax=Nonomuraea aurantiaca TaxID=2878562 RepID=UPI001CDA358F|nr:hypothetical protein [Nonomuraea aurantiaca]MCA2230327.1 hypothetical protein [Nonomuraea aurantiaca]